MLKISLFSKYFHPPSTSDYCQFSEVGLSSIAFADVDNDGDQDVLITGGDNNFDLISELYTNDGSGNFGLVNGTPFTGVSLSSIAFADVDADGDQDVLITGLDNSSNRIAFLYRNTTINVSIAENTLASNLRFYPNPTKGEFNLELGQEYAKLNLIVRNALGQQIAVGNYNNTNFINLTIEGDAGLYFVELIANNNLRTVLKLVKE